MITDEAAQVRAEKAEVAALSGPTDELEAARNELRTRRNESDETRQMQVAARALVSRCVGADSTVVVVARYRHGCTGIAVVFASSRASNKCCLPASREPTAHLSEEANYVRRLLQTMRRPPHCFKQPKDGRFSMTMSEESFQLTRKDFLPRRCRALPGSHLRLSGGNRGSRDIHYNLHL